MSDIKDYKRARCYESNGRVLRRINIIRTGYVSLTTVERVVSDEGVRPNEYTDAINYLSEEGYIHLRRISGHAPAELADTDWQSLEAKVSAKGIRLLAGTVSDPLVEV